MRLKLTLVLVILNVALYALILHLGRNVAVEDPTGRDVFTQGFAASATRIEIVGTGGSQRWELEKTGPDRWEILSPVKWDANIHAVRQFCDLLGTLRADSQFPVSELKGDDPLAIYGLSKPVARIRLSNAAGSEEFAIGDNTGMGSNVYALSVDRSRVLVLKSDLLAGINEAMVRLRSDRMLSVAPEEVRFLTLDRMGQARVRFQNEDGRWSMTNPVASRADSREVSAALQTLLNAHIPAFFPEDYSHQGLENPSLKVALDVANGKSFTVLLGDVIPDARLLPAGVTAASVKDPATGADDGPWCYARLDALDRPGVFAVRQDVFKPFMDAQSVLRDKHLLDRPASSLVRIGLRGGESTTVLERLEDGKWTVSAKVADENRQSADPDVVKRLLAMFDEMEVISFVTDAPSQEEIETLVMRQPVLEVSFRNEVKPAAGGAPAEFSERVLRLGRSPGGLSAKFDDQPSIYRVSWALADELPPAAIAYHLRVLEEFPKDADVTRMVLTRLSDGARLVDESVDPVKVTWFTRPGGREPRGAALANLSTALCPRLRVAKFVSDSFDASTFRYAIPSHEPTSGRVSKIEFPWAYRLEATVSVPQPAPKAAVERKIDLLLTSALSAKAQYAGSAAHRMQFLLDPAMIRDLDVLVSEAERALVAPAPAVPVAPPAPEAPASVPAQPQPPADVPAAA